MNKLGWNDLHTQLLNWTYSLYRPEFRENAHLANLGYFGRPDPTLEVPNGTDGKTVTPDFIATDKQGIVQIHDIKGFEGLMQRSNDDDIVSKIKEKLQDISKYRDILPTSIKSFFLKHEIRLDSYTMEVIVVMDFEFYTRYSTIINRCAKKLGLIVWSIDLTQKRIRKHVSSHLDKKLDRIFKPDVALPITPWCPPLALFTRQTDKRVKIYHFTSNLILALVQDSKLTVKFSEIDQLMIDSNPPKYAHLVPEEREQEWAALLYQAIKHAKILKQSNVGPNIYELQNPAILENPYSRNKLLEDLANQLGIMK